VTTSGPDWLRYQTADARALNPIVLRRLADQQVSVVTLSEVSQSLETVYLQIVAEDEIKMGNRL